MKILGPLERWKARRAFGKFISAGVRELIASPRKLPSEWTERKHFQFILVSLDDTKPDELPAVISKVIDTIIGQDVIILDMNPSLIIAVLGVPHPGNDRAELRAKLVATLLAEHGGLIRIAHGHCDGLAGLFGSERRFTWGVSIPGFSVILKRLFDTQFGIAVEVAYP